MVQGLEFMGILGTLLAELKCKEMKYSGTLSLLIGTQLQGPVSKHFRACMNVGLFMYNPE